MRRAAFALALSSTLGVQLSCSSQGSGEAGAAGGRYAAPPAMTVDKAKTYVATVETARGSFELTLDAARAPTTVNNFVFLARDRYYDGLVFHRVEPGFVVQTGDPEGNGTGGPGYTIPDEQSGLLHVEGALGMAKSAAPNSAGSQWYVTLSPQPSLDARYTVFGKVTAGMEVVKTIAKGDALRRVTISER